MDDGAEFTFGTSGLLYRSNKLMYDRQTFTLWGNLTGEPVLGKMASSDLRLKILPMTLTTWDEWKTLHPETKVLSVDPKFGERWNYRYEPGLADRARSGVSFPIWQKSNLLERNEEVYTLRIGDSAKAYRIEKLLQHRILNDQLGATPIVLISDPESGSVRAYRRRLHTFSFSAAEDKIKDEAGRVWQFTEEALTFDQTKLERIPGHVSLWFAWYGFFPHTEVWK